MLQGACAGGSTVQEAREIVREDGGTDSIFLWGSVWFGENVLLTDIMSL